jgi:hypothetical protein
MTDRKRGSYTGLLKKRYHFDKSSDTNAITPPHSIGIFKFTSLFINSQICNLELFCSDPLEIVNHDRGGSV